MNKFYIQIVLFLLSISIYVNNKTLATEPDPEENTKTESNKPYFTSEEIYEKNKNLLCTNPEEIKQAEELMKEAVTQLEHHIKSKGGYKVFKQSPHYDIIFYRKELDEKTNIQRIDFPYFHNNEYDEIINMLWDPALAKYFNGASVKRKFVRVYNPNLVIIQQRYKSWFEGREKYFYALAAKAQISEKKTIIAMTSANINDGYPSNKEYENKIIENANLFKTSINSEDDIRNGKLKKMFVNIAGYIVEKTSDHTKITYLESLDGHTSNSQKLFIETILNKFFNYQNNKLYLYS
ncbi:fam-a protein [Plasmodium vinckei brucechwatti]|uniref:Fam-a protein n=1 Tax=Plasmodium vinckei brucechwatti TaxID=119398 RepID=A0A6V7RWC9_PLAVN|nr:fam-a protein [Plasmodium vinckei brucechwatti]